MLTAYGLRRNFLQFFRIMADNKGMYLDVRYKGQLYRLHVEDMHTKVKYRHIRKKRPDLTSAINSGRCNTCGHTVINDVCMNTACPTNQRRTKQSKP